MFSYRFPVVRGVQANKEYFIGMLPLEYLSKLFPDDSDVVAPEFRAQRRVNEQRIPAIRDYILKNRTSYVFPHYPLRLTVISILSPHQVPLI